jgi:hypothetical protein
MASVHGACLRSIEGLDHDHPTTRARASTKLVDRFGRGAVLLVDTPRRSGRNIERLPAEREILGAMAIGEEAVMPNAILYAAFESLPPKASSSCKRNLGQKLKRQQGPDMSGLRLRAARVMRVATPSGQQRNATRPTG